MCKTKTYKKVISSLLIWVILGSQFLQAPSAQALFPFTDDAKEPTQITSLIAVLVDNELLADNTQYDGLSQQYTSDLPERTLRERIQRFSKDVQLAQPFTRSLILRVRNTDDPNRIAQALETLYFKGDGTEDEKTKLHGVITIGDVPLPVVNKNGHRFVSMYPYTDFEEKAYIYNYQNKEFVVNELTANPKVEVWHGVIKPPADGEEANDLISEYLDKNHLFHIGNPDFTKFDRKMLFADIFWEQQMMSEFALPRYENYAKFLEDISYKRFTKSLLKELIGTNDQEGDGIDDDLDGFIDEDPQNGIDDDGDELIDEDNGENPEAIDPEMFEGLPDAHTRDIILQYAIKFTDLLGNYLQRSNDFVQGTGRYRTSYQDAQGTTFSDYDSLVSLIAAKDLYVQEYLRTINEEIEQKTDEAAEVLQSDLNIAEGAQITGTVTFDDNTSANISPYTFSNLYFDSPTSNFFGLESFLVTSAEQCTIYQGSQSSDDDIAQLIEANRLYNLETEDADNTGYAGCHAGNIENPELCIPQLATKWIFDLLGSKLNLNIPTSATTYAGCLNFQNINSPNNIVLLPSNGLTFQDILEFYGGFDGIDNDEDGTIDEQDEFSLSYGIDPEDWFSIGRDILANRKNHFIINEPPFAGVSQIELFVTQQPAFMQPISSLIVHKEPTLDTIQLHIEEGTILDMPVDNPRFVAFQDQNGRFQQIIYPNTFETDNIDTFNEELSNLEERISNIPGFNANIIPIDGVLSGIIQPEAKKTQVADAIKWRNLTTEQKHVEILKAQIDRDQDSYVTEPVNGYEYMYLISEGDADSVSFTFNKDTGASDTDPELIDPLSNLTPEDLEKISEEDEEKDEEDEMGISILEWFPYILKYLAELPKLVNQSNFMDVEGDNEDLEKFLNEFEIDNDDDDNGIPNGAEPAINLSVSFQDNLTKIAFDSAEAHEATVLALDNNSDPVITDSFTEVMLEIVQPESTPRASIFGEDTLRLVNGQATFKILPTGTPGEFTLIAHSLNRPTKLLSNQLPIISEERKINLVTYQIEEGDEVPVFVDELPADGESQLFLRAEILDGNRDIMKADNTSTIEFVIDEESEELVSFVDSQVTVSEGAAITQIKSTTTAGLVDINANLVGDEIPSDPHQVFVTPLEPARLEVIPESPVIRTGGLSKTQITINVLDENENIVNNDFFEITVAAEGPGTLDSAADTQPDLDGIQLQSFEGTFTIDLFSSDIEGDIVVEATLNNLQGSTLVESLEEISIEITPDKPNLIADGSDSIILRTQAVDEFGSPIVGFNQPITFKSSNATVGTFTTDPITQLFDGDSASVFQSSTHTGPLEISATVPGLEPGTIEIPVLANDSREIRLETNNQEFDASPDKSISVEALLYDRYGNFVDFENEVDVTFRITEDTQKYGEIVGVETIRTQNGKATVELRGKDIAGPINLIASADGLISGSIKLKAIKKMKGRDLVGMYPEVLYSTMLGAPYGNVGLDDYAAGWLLFSGKTQAVTATTTHAKPAKQLLHVTNNGGIDILDPNQIQAEFLPANDTALPNRMIIRSIETLDELTEIFFMFPSDMAITLRDDVFSDIIQEGIYIVQNTDDEIYDFKLSEDSISITFDDIEAVTIHDTGSIELADNFFTITLSETKSPFLALNVSRGNDNVADIIFAVNTEADAQIVDKDFEYQLGFPYDPTAYIKPLTNQSNYKIESSFSGNSSVLPKGATLSNSDLEMPQDQAPGFSFTSFEKVFDEMGVGFDGDNKHALFFAAGNNVGESNKIYASDIGINLGDPTIRIRNEALAGTSGFTQDIGKPLLASN